MTSFYWLFNILYTFILIFNANCTTIKFYCYKLIFLLLFISFKLYQLSIVCIAISIECIIFIEVICSISKN